MPNSRALPEPLSATRDDLPVALQAPFDEPPDGGRVSVEAADIRWSALAWGDAGARPLLLLHGVTASAEVWWRIGPVLAAAGRHVVAPDLPGHGETGRWHGRHRFDDNARDVAAFTRAMRLDEGRLGVVGHSWGAMTAAALPAAGLIPERLVLVDPPSLPRDRMAQLVKDPINRSYESLAEARAAVAAANRGWSPRDVEAKAAALVRLEVQAARDVLLRNGDWDGGLASLAHPAARSVPTWLIRGEERAGGYIPDAAVPRLVARLGADRILTIAGAPHAPQRTHAAALLVALLRALGD